MKGSERRVYFYDLKVDTNKDSATTPALSEVVAAIDQQFKAGKAKHAINDKTAVLEIDAIEINERAGYALLHICISDTTASDPYLSNRNAKSKFRVVRKEDGEGRDYGAHLLIATTPTQPHTYLALLEKNIGLHRSHVRRLLQAVLRNLYKESPKHFTCDDFSGAKGKDGSPKQVNFRPMLELSGHPSEEFIEELEKGTLKDISLVHSEAKNQQLSGQPWLHPHEKILKVKAVSPNKVKDMWRQVLGVLKENSKQYEKARIRFKTPAGETQSVEVDSDTGNPLLDDHYVKTRRISKIDPPLDESSDGIVSHFAKLMLELMKSEQNGQA